MGREVRRVPKDWQHPKNDNGNFIPLYGRSYGSDGDEWDEGRRQWLAGFCRSYSDGQEWEPRDPKYANLRYTDYAGARPSPDDYMPDWPDSERTHYMMYEDTSEGTPISPAFATPEDLARWLADTGASAFGRSAASYEGWLRVCKGGFAPSMVISGGVIQTGVDAL